VESLVLELRAGLLALVMYAAAETRALFYMILIRCVGGFRLVPDRTAVHPWRGVAV
jgi:hypothetical protein